MADPVSFGDVNPFGSLGGLGSSSFASILLVFVIAIIILGLIGFLIYWKSVKKAYWIKIHVFRLIGNIPTRVAVYDAREIAFGGAGDKLWKVAGAGMFAKLKTIKWLPVGKIQTAPREFWYYIREDGEWINFQMQDLNLKSREVGVKFVNEDMRLQRLATERLLEQRLMNKTFWEKWGTIVMTLIFFLVVSVCMVIMFFQFSKLVDKFGEVARVNAETSKVLLRVFGEDFIAKAQNTTIGGNTGLIPA